MSSKRAVLFVPDRWARQPSRDQTKKRKPKRTPRMSMDRVAALLCCFPFCHYYRTMGSWLHRMSNKELAIMDLRNRVHHTSSAEQAKAIILLGNNSTATNGQSVIFQHIVIEMRQRIGECHSGICWGDNNESQVLHSGPMLDTVSPEIHRLHFLPLYDELEKYRNDIVAKRGKSACNTQNKRHLSMCLFTEISIGNWMGKRCG